MTEYIHAIVRFAEAHAVLIYVLAFVATWLETVAIVGFLIPGSTIMVAFGALIPSGAVGFWGCASGRSRAPSPVMASLTGSVDATTTG